MSLLDFHCKGVVNSEVMFTRFQLRSQNGLNKLSLSNKHTLKYANKYVIFSLICELTFASICTSLLKTKACEGQSQV
jgi:hypothetical protein